MNRRASLRGVPYSVTVWRRRGQTYSGRISEVRKCLGEGSSTLSGMVESVEWMGLGRDLSDFLLDDVTTGDLWW